MKQFSEALRDAINDRSLTLAGVSERLGRRGTPVSKATLSYWCSGRRQPEHAASMDALVALEEMLGLPEGNLVELLGPSRRVPQRPRAPYTTLIGSSVDLPALLGEIGCSNRDALVSTGGSLVVDIGPDGRVWRTSNRMVWRATQDDVQSTAVFVELDDPLQAPVIRPVSGCTIGKTRFDRAARFMAAELLFDQPIPRNGTAITEHTIEDIVETSPATHYESVSEGPVTEASIWVRFASEAVPTNATAYSDSATRSVSRTARVQGHTLHHVVRSFGPGVFGLRWH